MDLDEANDRAHQLLDRHGLTDRRWAFRFDNAAKRLGVTRHNRQEISLSRAMVAANDLEFVHQILLHEIAHTLLPSRRNDGSAYGHGREWRRLATQLGYTGKRTVGAPPVAETVGGQHRGIVTKHGRTHIHFRAEDGRVWSAAFAHVTRVEPAAPRTELA